MPELLRDKYICFVCNKSQSKFRCGRCHSITYCGGECQKKDLKRHKKNCSPVVYKYENDQCFSLLIFNAKSTHYMFNQGNLSLSDYR